MYKVDFDSGTFLAPCSFYCCGVDGNHFYILMAVHIAQCFKAYPEGKSELRMMQDLRFVEH